MARVIHETAGSRRGLHQRLSKCEIRFAREDGECLSLGSILRYAWRVAPEAVAFDAIFSGHTERVLLVAKRSAESAPWISRTDLDVALDEFADLVGASPEKSSRTMGLLLESKVQFSDVDLLYYFSSDFFVVDDAGPSRVCSAGRKVKSRLQSILSGKLEYAAILSWMMEEREKRGAGWNREDSMRHEKAHLAFRMKLHDLMRGKVLKPLWTDWYPLFKFSFSVLAFFRHPPRLFFEQYLLDSLVSQSHLLASETKTINVFPSKAVKDGLQELVAAILACPQARTRATTRLMLSCLDGLGQFKKTLMAMVIEGPLTRSQRIAAYDIAQILVSRSILFSAKGSVQSELVNAVPVLERHQCQRRAFLAHFDTNAHVDSHSIDTGFPAWFRERFEAFEEGSDDGLRLFGFDKGNEQTWRERYVVGAQDGSSGVDRKVMFALSLFEFVYPELRRLPPYANSGEFRTASASVVRDYKRLMSYLEFYFDDVPFDRGELYSAAGCFIKSVFRLRGRREVLGLWQVLKYDEVLAVQRHCRNFSRIASPSWWRLRFARAAGKWCRRERIEDSSRAFRRIVHGHKVIDKNGFMGATSIGQTYDGPFFVNHLFSGEPDGVLEKVIAAMINQYCVKLPDRVIGVGNKGTLPASLLSLVLGIPMSSATLRPSFDISPRLPRGESICVLDDCIRTGFTLSSILRALSGPKEPVRRFEGHWLIRRHGLRRNLTVGVLCNNKSEDMLPEGGSGLDAYLERMDKAIQLAKPLVCVDVNAHQVELADQELQTALRMPTDRVQRWVEATLRNRVSKLVSDPWSPKCRARLERQVRRVCATGLPHDIGNCPKEFRRSRAANWLCSKVKTDQQSSPTYSESAARRIAHTLLWESGAKYKPCLLFNRPELVWKVGAYFYSELTCSPKEAPPDAILVNSRLTVPFAVALCLIGRYANPPHHFRLLLAKSGWHHIVGLQQLLEEKANEPARGGARILRIATMTNMTAHTVFERRLWARVKEYEDKFNNGKPNESRVTCEKGLICSLFDVKYAREDQQGNRARTNDLERRLADIRSVIQLV